MDRFAKYRCLVALAHHGHYGNAAHDLGVSQPALSRSIQVLEESVGARLVDRAGKRATLTPMGELMAGRAELILRDLDDLEYEVEQARGVERGQLAIGAGPYAAALFVPALLSSLAQRFPTLRLSFELETWRLLIRRLKEHRLDLVIAEAADAKMDLELEVTLLHQHPAYLAVRRDHPLATQRPTLSDVGRFPFAVPTLPARIQAHFQGAFGIHWSPTLQCDDVPLLVSFVKRTNAVMLATPALLEADPGLVRLPVEEFWIDSRFGVIQLAGRRTSLAARHALASLSGGSLPA